MSSVPYTEIALRSFCRRSPHTLAVFATLFVESADIVVPPDCLRLTLEAYDPDLGVLWNLDNPLVLCEQAPLAELLDYIEAYPEVAVAYRRMLRYIQCGWDFGVRKIISNRSESAQCVTVLRRILSPIPQNPYALAALAYLTDYTERQTFPNGETLSLEDMCHRALRANPTHAMAYYCLSHVDTLVLPDGRVLHGQQSILLEVLRHDPTEYAAYGDLALSIDPGESITVPSGRVMSCGDLHLESLRLDPNDATGYSNMGFYMLVQDPAFEGLWEGQPLTSERMFVEALKRNPRCRYAIQGLLHLCRSSTGVMLPYMLPDGRVFSSMEDFSSEIDRLKTEERSQSL